MDTWVDKNKPISQQIRERITKAGERFFAADNISRYIEDGEREKLIDELTTKFEAVLDSLVIDRTNDPNSSGTGRRLAKMYINEIMGGRYNPAPEVTTFPNEDGRYDQLIVIRSDIKSMCSHHHQPVSGVCYIGCLPGKRLIGLSKYTRIAQHQAARGHLRSYNMYKEVKPFTVGSEDSIQRLSDNAFIPFDPANTDYTSLS